MSRTKPFGRLAPFATAALLGAVVVLPISTASAQVPLTVVHEFTGSDGSSPTAALILAADGNVYGTTSEKGTTCPGGPHAPACGGTAFKMDPAGTVTTLKVFTGGANGAFPDAPLVQAADGNFYGTTVSGGQSGAWSDLGTVFKLAPDGTVAVLHVFTPTDGSHPHASLIQATDGNLYGTTRESGTSFAGTVFKMTLAGAFTVLHTFVGGPADGRAPRAALIQATDGSFYGTTEFGGSADAGTVFKMTADGAVTLLHSFGDGADGARPFASLIQATDGNLYGTTHLGGDANQGSIFRISLAGSYSVLYSFTGGADGWRPWAPLIQASDGNLYGTTYGNPNAGTLFKMTLSGNLTLLHTFTGGLDDGRNPMAGLLQMPGGYLSGVTSSGGAGLGTDGVVFRLGPLTPGAPMALHAATSSNPTNVLVWTAASEAASYAIRRGTSAGAETDLATGITATSFPDVTAARGTTYYYTVVAVNGFGAGGSSGEVSATSGRAARGDFTGDGQADLVLFDPVSGTWTGNGLAPQSWGIAGDILVPADYLGTGATQMAVWRPSNGYWYVKGGASQPWGIAGDIPVPGDYLGSGQAQVAVFRPSNAYWYVQGGASVQWGQPGDIPVPADYNGDGVVEIAVFRPSNGYWYVYGGANISWGQAGDIPVPADYNGDGRTEIAVYRPSSIDSGPWWLILGVGNWTIGSVGDQPIAQDFNGDGRAELAVYRPATGAAYSYDWSTGAWTTTALAANQVVVGLPIGLRRPVTGDSDQDRRRDAAVYRPSTGAWWVLYSSGGHRTWGWGLSTDVPVPGDYDGDGRMDGAVYRPSTGGWHLLFSSTNYTTSRVVGWGLGTDTPLVGDFDGDGRADLTVYRPSTGQWFIKTSSSDYATSFALTWGIGTDTPIVGDFDGDLKADPTVYRDGSWWSLLSSQGYTTYRFLSAGVPGDMPVAGDFDGDGRADVAIYRPSSGDWWVLTSSSNYASWITVNWGAWTGGSYEVVAGDYDGDGRTDFALWNSAAGGWYILQSSTGFTTYRAFLWGESGDTAVPKP